MFIDESFGPILSAIMPAQEACTLLSRQTDDSTVSISLANVRRTPMSNSDMLIAGAQTGEVWIKYQAYEINLLSAAPKVGDKIIDAEGVTWQVRRVTTKFFKTVADMLCIKNK